jgi:hypothetical protein
MNQSFGIKIGIEIGQSFRDSMRDEDYLAIESMTNDEFFSRMTGIKQERPLPRKISDD